MLQSTAILTQSTTTNSKANIIVAPLCATPSFHRQYNWVVSPSSFLPRRGGVGWRHGGRIHSVPHQTVRGNGGGSFHHASITFVHITIVYHRIVHTNAVDQRFEVLWGIAFGVALVYVEHCSDGFGRQRPPLFTAASAASPPPTLHPHHSWSIVHTLVVHRSHTRRPSSTRSVLHPPIRSPSFTPLLHNLFLFLVFSPLFAPLTPLFFFFSSHHRLPPLTRCRG